MKKEVRHTWHFPHSSTREVWDHLTQPELLAQWLMYTDFAPIVGHRFGFHGACSEEAKEKAFAQCEVLEIIPDQKLVYSWAANSVLDGKPFDSVVTWTLHHKDGGTELQLLHAGFRTAEDAIAHNDGWSRIGGKMVELSNAVLV
jgi:uncharacterized protein YndB with AHSA1/START domain